MNMKLVIEFESRSLKKISSLLKKAVNKTASKIAAATETTATEETGAKKSKAG